MTNQYTTLIGKAVRYIAQLRGGGSALPGLFVEKIDPKFIAKTLEPLPRGVVVISGTNGKTTTTKIVVELLQSQGLKVFTNRTGSNFSRGVAAALLGEVDSHGQLDADIAVLELDEAHAVNFVKGIKPRYSLLLNVMRDQLDRFGETDTTAGMLHAIAENTTDTVVLNRDDPHLDTAEFANGLSAKLRSFGTHPDLRTLFPSDDNLRNSGDETLAHEYHLETTDTSLETVTDQGDAVIAWSGQGHPTSLKLSGVYNILNATAAIALVRAIVADELDELSMLDALSRVTPAFGRGETIEIGGQPCELILVKNPAGFRLSLRSFPPRGNATMIAVNDNYADGRDMSWLWDVDFDDFEQQGVDMVSGIRAYDMALRLQYDEVAVRNVETDLAKALEQFLASSSDTPRRIFCTYTAMLKLRKTLSQYTTIEEVRA